jgi:polysaccharide biosynthesis/export protein
MCNRFSAKALKGVNMLNCGNVRMVCKRYWENLPGFLACGGTLAAALLLLVAASGCQTASSPAQFSDVSGKSKAQPIPPVAATNPSLPAVSADSLVLHEGDVVRITFPGAPTLNTVQPIRRDGQISLPLGGEFKAAGLTPAQVQKAMLDKYGPQLVMKEVVVTVDSSSYPVYVTGAVLRSGKIVYDRPVTALEAVMEAGVDYTKANLKAVAVTRLENGHSTHYKLNLKQVLHGDSGEAFTLKPSDIVFVPERFTWF